MKQKGKYLGLGLIPLALVFLFNPNITVIDLLPDFIGYWLLCVAFSKLGDLQETLGEAVVAFRKMILIDAAKILALLWIFGMSVPAERSASILLWTFVFGVLEMIFLLPAYGKLFGGLLALGYFYENHAILGASGKRQKSPTEKIRNFTWFFVVIKAVLPILPELADLTNVAYDETTGFINLYRFIGLLRGMAFIPVLIVGIVWFFKAQVYFARLRKDDTLMGTLRSAYEEKVLPKAGIFARRDIRVTCLLLIVALCLTLDLRMDGQNIMPDFLAAAIFLIMFIMMTRKSRHRGWLCAVIPYLGFALLASAAEYYFFEHYRYGLLIKNEGAMLSYGVLLVCNALKGISFIGTILFFIREMRGVIDQHTGFVVGREYVTEQEGKMIADQQRELKGTLTLAGIFSGVYVLTDLCHDLFVPNLTFLVFIPPLFGLVCIGFFVRAMSAIQNAVDTKYMLE